MIILQKKFAYEKCLHSDKKIDGMLLGQTFVSDGDGYTFTEVCPYALKGYNNVYRVIIENTYEKLDPNAFSGCKGLRVLSIQSKKLTKESVKGCLKGCKVNLIYVPKSKKAYYKKIFTKANTGNKLKITVK